MGRCHLWSSWESFFCRCVAGPRGNPLDPDLARALSAPACYSTEQQNETRKNMNSIFYIIGVVVVVLVVMGYLGLR
jgi:hypothetical protein